MIMPMMPLPNNKIAGGRGTAVISTPYEHSPAHVATTLEKYFPGVAVNVNEAESLALGETRNVDPNRCELVLIPSATVPNDAPGKNVKSVIVAIYDPGAAIVNGVDSASAGPTMVPTWSKIGVVEALEGLLAPRSSQAQTVIPLITRGKNRFIFSLHGVCLLGLFRLREQPYLAYPKSCSDRETCKEA